MLPEQECDNCESVKHRTAEERVHLPSRIRLSEKNQNSSHGLVQATKPAKLAKRKKLSVADAAMHTGTFAHDMRSTADDKLQMGDVFCIRSGILKIK